MLELARVDQSCYAETQNVHTCIIFGRDVVGQVVIQDETKQAIQERQVDFLVNLGQHRLHQYYTFSIAGLPYVRQVIDSLAPLDEDLSFSDPRKRFGTNLIYEERRGFSIRRFDPSREEASLVSSVVFIRESDIISDAEHVLKEQEFIKILHNDEYSGRRIGERRRTASVIFSTGSMS